MALTGIQRDILSVISTSRVFDIDLFHDTREALSRTWPVDQALLVEAGFALEIIRELPGMVEATVEKGGARTLVQWAVDGAFRFFPLVNNDLLGLSLHPFDLATNKVLALVGRLEVRDWIDVLGCSSNLQPLGYLAWAACGKDPGLNPDFILGEAARSARYTQQEVDSLDFDGGPPEAAALSRSWKSMLGEAATIAAALPPDSVGSCVLGTSGGLYRGGVRKLAGALEKREISFHKGSIRGAFPTFPGT
jgi:hypothetical protein